MAIRVPWNKGLKGLQPWHNTSGLGKNIDFKGRGKSCSETRKGVPLSEEHRQALSESQTKKWTDPEYKKTQSEAMKGRDVWNAGIGDQEGRMSIQYKSWRLAVLERDDYTCRGCGERDCKMEVHHIKSWAEHKDLRFVVNNGITYCPKCHCKNDKFRARTYKE